MRPLLLVMLTACTVEEVPAEDDTDARPGALLVDHAAWTLGTADGDPVPSHRPAEDPCPVDGWYPHGAGIEVHTGRCAYFLGVQPSLVDVAAGDRIELFLSHDRLVSEDAEAEGHVVLALGDAVLWELTVPIPQDATPYPVVVTAPEDAPAGTPVALHLHNHGANTWTLLDVTVEAP